MPSNENVVFNSIVQTVAPDLVEVDYNDFNTKNNLYGEREVNNRNYAFNSIKRSTQTRGGYHFSNQEDYP